MYQNIDSLKDTGYSLTAAERAHLDKRHRFWAAVTLGVCFGLLALLVAYPSLARFAHN